MTVYAVGCLHQVATNQVCRFWQNLPLRRRFIVHHNQWAKRYLSTSEPTITGLSVSESSPSSLNSQRVWLDSAENNNASSFWTKRVVDAVNDDNHELSRLYKKIEAQEVEGGRMRQRKLGVLHADPATDMQMICDNYTVKAVASALRDREDALQYAAVLSDSGRWDELQQFLRVYHPKFVLERRYGPSHLNNENKEFVGSGVSPTDIGRSLSRDNLELIRKGLMRMPRTVTQAHDKRAGVVIALCTVEGVPCILLEKRSSHLRAHPDEVALPGGMVCEVEDPSIVSTCLREMKEEIGGLPAEPVDVLGVLRCNWGEIHHLVNVAVTPVVCYWGELPEKLYPNPDEVAQVFTVPLSNLIDRSLWIHREGLAPIFVGGPQVVWGLSGYVLERFAIDILHPIARRQRGSKKRRRNVEPTEEELPVSTWR